MKQTTKIIVSLIIAVTAILLGIIIFRRPAPPKQAKPTVYETKEQNGGDVTVIVTPLSLKDGLPASFDVAIETHSVDLAFDVEKIASLTTDTKTAYTPFWDGSPPGGHHRKGVLRFTPDLKNVSTVTLTFKDIAGVEHRTFTWEVNQ